MTYTFKDHTADIAVEIKTNSLERLFEEAALATMETQVDLSSVEKEEKMIIELENENKEKLLFDFLDQIIYLKDSESILFSDFDVKIEETKLFCTAYGERINSEKMKLKVDVKAITYHDFILEEKDEWFAYFVLDI